tara:strand:- start:872 stop:1147 length:276 start_codon:yes stop_codon:yes gene_type:complete
MSTEEDKYLEFTITFREDEMFSACEIYTLFEQDEDIICDEFGKSEDVEWSEMEGEGEVISYSFTIKNPEKKDEIISRLYNTWGGEIESIEE